MFENFDGLLVFLRVTAVNRHAYLDQLEEFGPERHFLAEKWNQTRVSLQDTMEKVRVNLVPEEEKSSQTQGVSCSFE